MRGPHGALARFRGGELLVFMIAGVNPHEIAGVATFVRNHVTTLGDAWGDYGDLLGAGSFEDFLAITPIENPNSNSSTAVLEAEHFRVIDPSIRVVDSGITDKFGATRGWYLEAEETDRLLDRLGEAYPEPEDAGFGEGDRVLRRHCRLERNSTVVELAKRRWLERDPELACEVCGFSFVRRYGPIGVGFIEAHHRTALKELEQGAIRFTREADLAPVCGNCHRMLHTDGGRAIGELTALLR